MMFKAFVKDKETGESKFIESDYPSKSDFVTDLKHNGYSVSRVEPKDLYDFVLDNFDGDKHEWEVAKKLYKEGKPLTKEEYEKMKDEGYEIVNDKSLDAIKDNFTPPGAKSKREPIKPTDFGFPSISAFDDDIKNHPRGNTDWSDVVENVMGNAETEGMSEEELDKLRGQIEGMVSARAEELSKDRQFDKDEDIKVEDVDTSAIDEKDSGKSEEDDLDLYMKDLDDYMTKNKKGRDDIPVTTRR